MTFYIDFPYDQCETYRLHHPQLRESLEGKHPCPGQSLAKEKEQEFVQL